MSQDQVTPLVTTWVMLGLMQAGLTTRYVEERRRASADQLIVLFVLAWLLAPLLLVMWLSVGAFVLGRIFVRGTMEWKRDIFPNQRTAPRDAYLQAAQREVEVIAPNETAEPHILGTRET